MVFWVAVIDDHESHVSLRRSEMYDKPKAVFFIQRIPSCSFQRWASQMDKVVVLFRKIRGRSSLAPCPCSVTKPRPGYRCGWIRRGGRQQVAIHAPGDQAVFDRNFATQFAHQEQAHDRQQQGDCHTAEPCRLPVGSFVVWLIAATGALLLHANPPWSPRRFPRMSERRDGRADQRQWPRRTSAARRSSPSPARRSRSDRCGGTCGRGTNHSIWLEMR
jgi:hypothetical protein